jgi:hypothetical protein
MKQLLIHALALALILGSATTASRHARGFLMIGQTPSQSSNLLLVSPGVMALVSTGMPLKIQ